MSLTSRIREARATSPFGTEDDIPSPGQAGVTFANPLARNIDEGVAMRLAVVYACVRIIANSVAKLPFDAVKMRGTYREQLDPAPPIIADPFGAGNNLAGMTRRAGISSIVVSLLLRGNAFCLVTGRNYLGFPTRLMVLDPDMVSVKVDDAGYRAYEVGNIPVRDGDMVHIAGLSMPGSPVGISPITNMRNAVALGLTAELFGLQFFSKGSLMSGVIEVEQDLDKTRARQMKENFEASHSGLANAHSIGVLTGGASFKPISVSPEDAQFLGTRAAQNLDVAMMFGVPPHMLGQVDRTTSWGKGIEEQKLGFLNFTMEPLSGLLEDAWSVMLPKPQTAKFNLDVFLRADTSTRYTAYMAARNGAWMTINEIRALENNPPIDGGDELFAPLNSAHTLATMTTQDDDDLDDDGKTPPADPGTDTKP